MKEGDRLRRALKIRNRILNVMRSEVVILVGACNWEGDWFCIDFSRHTLANYWKEGYKSHSWKTRKPGREFGWSFQYFYGHLHDWCIISGRKLIKVSTSYRPTRNDTVKIATELHQLSLELHGVFFLFARVIHSEARVIYIFYKCLFSVSWLQKFFIHTVLILGTSEQIRSVELAITGG